MVGAANAYHEILYDKGFLRWKAPPSEPPGDLDFTPLS